MATEHDDYYRVQDPPVDGSTAHADEIEGELDRVQRGFNKLPNQNQLAFGRHLYGVEDLDHTRGNNFYKVTTDYPPVFPDGVAPGYLAGDRVTFIAKKTSTNASPMVNIDGVRDAPIKEVDGSNLAIGGISSNWPVELLFDGEVFRSQNTANRSVNRLQLSNFIGDKAFTEDLQITNFVLPEARAGTAPYTYAAAPLPAGMAFDSKTLEVSGTPTTTGITTVVYQVTDSAGVVVTQSFRITIHSLVALRLPDPSNLVFVADSLVAGVILPEASGGTSPYTYEITNIETIPGLSFSAGSRLLSGTPTTPGNYALNYR